MGDYMKYGLVVDKGNQRIQWNIGKRITSVITYTEPVEVEYEEKENKLSISVIRRVGVGIYHHT